MNSTNSNIIECAVIYIEKDSKVLGVTRRNSDLYGLPGGKVDPGETVYEALVRELREETGVILTKSDIRPFFIKSSIGVDKKQYIVTCFMLSDFSISIQPYQCEKDILVNWITREQLITGAFPSYNVDVIKHFDRLK